MTQSNQPQGDSGFFTDLHRLGEIRSAHKAPAASQDRPEWHSDVGFLLGFIDRLWNEYSRRGNELEPLQAAADEVLRAYMPQFPDSRAVDDCLVALAAARCFPEVKS